MRDTRIDIVQIFIYQYECPACNRWPARHRLTLYFTQIDAWWLNTTMIILCNVHKSYVAHIRKKNKIEDEMIDALIELCLVWAEKWIDWVEWQSMRFMDRKTSRNLYFCDNCFEQLDIEHAACQWMRFQSVGRMCELWAWGSFICTFTWSNQFVLMTYFRFRYDNHMRQQRVKIKHFLGQTLKLEITWIGHRDIERQR